jgi:hypothetical protein
MIAPKINTAIPERRYQIGAFTAVILGNVESADGRTYHHILALVPDGEDTPNLFITSEQAEPGLGSEGDTIVRVIARDAERALGPDARWRDLDAFSEDALAMVQRVMGLTDEELVRLL